MPKKEYKYVTDPGNYNVLPSPCEEVDIGEFFFLFFHYEPLEIEFRQIWGDSDFSGFRGNCKIFWFSDVAYALMSPKEMVYEVGKNNRYKDTPRCYRIGCKHNYRELTSQECKEKGFPHYGEHWHSLECQLCGHFNCYDSSD